MKTTIDLVNDDIWVLTRIFLEKKQQKTTRTTTTRQKPALSKTQAVS